MSIRTAYASVTLAAFAPLLCAQPKEFDVASVKQNKLDDRIVTINVGPGGRFDARGYTLVLLIQRAYGVMDWNVTGGPAWIREDRWDVSAKVAVPGNLTDKQFQPMLQALLADRFKLKLHRTSKEISGYALVAARGGPQLTASSESAENPDSFRMNNAGLNGKGIAMADFARYVGGKLGLIAVDKTGMTGIYDFDLKWEPYDPNTMWVEAGGDAREVFRARVNDALQKKLGLKLVQQKITIDELVIDSVERASAN